MKKILVIGSANMDLSLNVYRVPDKGETVVDNGGVAYTPGGKGANAAAAFAKLGADVTLCTKLGQDT
ncbi:MAG: ribokinase, partial [Clostridia bacterium]|nr:ribokinase [Clostridia bacterium]